MKNDSIKSALMKMGADCVGDLKSHAGDMAQQLKLQFYSFAETKLLPPAAKTEYVECIAEQVTKAYPYGLSGAQKDSLRKVINKGREHCLKSMQVNIKHLNIPGLNPTKI